MNRLNQVVEAGRKLLCKLFGYVVYSHDYNAAHYCITWGEAVEWMQCYPLGDIVEIQHRGKYMAMISQ